MNITLECYLIFIRLSILENNNKELFIRMNFNSRTPILEIFYDSFWSLEI